MKKGLLILCLLALVTSCTDAVETTQNNSTEITTEQLVSHLNEAGFNTEGYLIQGDIIIVEEDIEFNINELKKDILSPDRSKQWHHKYTVSPYRIGNIKVKLNSNIPSSWKAATRYAFARWNEISGSKVKFQEVSSGQEITISYTTLSPTSTIARASFPNSSGVEGPTIRINTNYNSMSTSKKRFTMVHELGHCIGMRHINNTESDRVQIRGTSTTDSKSVMNPTVKPWVGFSSGDKTAARNLYPASGKYAVLYEHKNYTGRSYVMKYPYNVNESHLKSAKLNDRISSIRVFGGAKVTMYRNKNYAGDAMLATYGYSNLSDYDFNDRISSVRWKAPTGKYALLYRHKNYRGRQITVEGNISNLGSLGFNNKASSVKLYSGAKVRLYNGYNYTGSSKYISSWKSNLSSVSFNDKASSVRLY